MKEANVIALHKAGDRNIPNNYRPVSLTPIIAKIMESIMHDKLTSHIENNDLINSCQHGFRKNYSTTSNMIYFWNDITSYANNHHEISIIYTDLRKAFDSVPHDLLIYKLRRLGIQHNNIKWFSSFLENRQQSVRINDSISNHIHIQSGVPQGGVLSGTLFNLYIGDMVDDLRYLKASMYADDTKLYGPLLDQQTKQHIQTDIDSVVNWCKRWRLSLNVNKCFFLHYRPAHSNQEYPTYFMDDCELQRKESARDLGVTVCQNLKLHDQVSKACKDATRQINIIRRTFVSRDPKFLASMYKMHVRPRLEYCIQMWNPVYAGDIERMEKVQNRYTRLVINGQSMTPAQRNHRLGITSHRTRRLRGDLIQMYKMISDTSLFPRSSITRTRGHSQKLEVPVARNNIRKHSFTVRNVNVWNSLPAEIVNAETINVFKSKIDLYLAQN